MPEMYDRYAQSVLSARIDPATGRDIRLRVDGADWQMADVSTALRHLTALPKNTRDGSGETKIPLTWAMVTQCAKLMEERGFGWKPDPDLNQWIYDEFMRRHDESTDLKLDLSSLVFEPMPHQLAGAYVGAVNKRFFYGDEAGVGKTATALLTVAELDARGLEPFPLFVVAPASVCDQWLEELAERFPDWPATLYAGPKRKNLSSRYKMYVMSWDVFRMDMKHEKDELPPLLRFLVPKTVVMDEAHCLCLEHNSEIQTSLGPKQISEVREGDLVLGVDHETGLDCWTQVLKTGRSPLRPTVQLGELRLTPDHPVWVTDSSPACVCYASSHDQAPYLRDVRELAQSGRVSEQSRTGNVLTPMPGESSRAEVQAREPGSTNVSSVRREIRGASVHSASPDLLLEGVRYSPPSAGGSFVSGDARTEAGCPEEPGEGPELTGHEGIPELGAQPIQGAGRGEDQAVVDGSEQEAWVSDTNGRERGAYYPAGAVAEAARLGVHPRVLSQPGTAATGLPDVLQGGSRVCPAEASSRAGREQSPLEVPAGAGSEEGREAFVSWLDGTEVLEQGRPGEYLWNLATDTGNYVAAGILVHNCNWRTRQSTAARQIARVAENVYPMSGTPITRDVGGFWAALSVLDVRSFPDQERYKERYTDRYKKEYGQQEVEGLTTVHRQEFFTLMQGSMRRVAKEDVLTDLPPKTYQTRVVKIPPAYRAAYDEMAKDMIAHLPDTDEPLEVMSTLAQLQRLTQLASSACDVAVEMVLEEREDHPLYGQEVPKTHVTMREPSWKIDELMQVMDEMQGSPLITFSPHTQLINLAGKRAASHGYRVGYITGEQSRAKKTLTRKAFQNGEIDLLCCNTAAGGVGLNLTAASTMVFLERSFAFWQASQNEDRIHRRGQTEQVTIIDIVAEKSVENRVRQAMRDKAHSLSELVRDKRVVESFLRDQPITV